MIIDICIQFYSTSIYKNILYIYVNIRIIYNMGISKKTIPQVFFPRYMWGYLQMLNTVG